MSLLTSINERETGDSYFAPSGVVNPQMYDIDLGGLVLVSGATTFTQSGYFNWNFVSTDLQAIFSITSGLCDKPTGIQYAVLVVPDTLPDGIALIPASYDHTILYSTNNAINTSSMYSPDAVTIPLGTRCLIKLAISIDSVTNVTITGGTAVLSLAPSTQFL